MEGIPVYVTRKTANGYTGSIKLNPYTFVVVWGIVVFNIFLWGLLGIYFAISTAINIF